MGKIDQDPIRKLKLVGGICCLVFLFPLIMMIITGLVGKYPFFTLVSLGFCALAFYLFYDALAGKDRLSYSQYSDYKEMYEYVQMNNKRTEYENLLVNNEQYELYKELSRIYPNLYYNYASSVLNQPIAMYKPVSPSTAAYVGTRVGGVAVGMAAAQEAKRKEALYKQNVEDVIRSQITIGSAKEQIQKCHNKMVGIIRTNPKARDDWDETVKSIEDDLHKKYKIK